MQKNICIKKIDLFRISRNEITFLLHIEKKEAYSIKFKPKGLLQNKVTKTTFNVYFNINKRPDLTKECVMNSVFCVMKYKVINCFEKLMCNTVYQEILIYNYYLYL